MPKMDYDNDPKRDYVGLSDQGGEAAKWIANNIPPARWPAHQHVAAVSELIAAGMALGVVPR